MPTSKETARVSTATLRRLASAVAALGSVALLATCDLDKITSSNPSRGFNNPTIAFAIAGGDQVVLADTTRLSVSPALTNVVVRWSSSAPAIARVDSVTGLVTGLAIGEADITARVLSMELDTGYTRQKTMTVRYKGIRIAPISEIQGLGQQRSLTINGLDKNDVVQPTALTGATFTIHDSGSTAQTIASLNGTAVKALKNGVAYVKATYQTSMVDSAKVRVRQFAKNITFPSASGSPASIRVGSLNTNRTIAAAVVDLADSTIASPTVAWSVLDTSVATVGAATGVLRAKKVGSTTLRAQVDTVIRSVPVVVQQVAAIVVKDSGDAQSVGINSAVPVKPRVVVTDSGNAPVAGASVLFEVMTGGGAVTGATQTTSAAGVATVGSWTLGPTAGTQTLKATAGAGSATFSVTALPGPARELKFTVEPASQTANTSLNPAVKVAIVDSAGNVVTSSTGAITLALGANPGSATLTGTLTVNAVDGVATFSDLKLSAVGSGYTLVATSGTLTSTASSPFNIFGAATKLGFVRQPANGVAQRTLAPIQVAIQDALGNTVTTATTQVTVAFGNNPGSATLGGTRTVAAVNGIATFDDLTVSTAGTGYTLSATATGLTAATSTSFNITPVGTAARLLFITEPTNTTATVGINATTSPAGIRVAIVDSGGQTVTTATNTITLSILNNPGGSTSSLSGTTQRAAVSGIATFGGLSINKVGTGYTLLAVAAGTTLSSDTSAAFNITTGPITKLGFVVPPSNINVSQVITPAIQVAVQDAGGNTVTGSLHQITLAASSGTLGGTTTQQVSSATGIATFSNITHATAGNNYTITATSSPVLTSAVSPTFNVVPAGGATRLRFLQEPSNATAGSNISPSITVEVTDGSNNRVTSGSYSVTLAIADNPGGGTISGSLTQSTSSGIATFSNIRIDKSGSGYTLSASASGLTSATSAGFNITHGAATRVGFVAQPQDVVAGTALRAVSVAVQDDNGNTVLNSTATIEMAMGSQNPCCQNLGGTVLVQAVNGIATFSNLRLSKAGTHSLNARIQGSTTFSVNSSTFTVSPAPASRLVFPQHINNFTAGGTVPNARVEIQDSVGNVVTSATNAIVLAIAAGPTGAVLEGTTTVNPVNGVATFSDLVLKKSSDRSPVQYQLSATTSGLTSGLSNNFNVNAGAPAKLVWLRSAATNAIRNGALSTPTGNPAVNLADQYDNETGSATSFSVTISHTGGTTGAVLGGTKTKSTDGGGFVSFDDLTLSQAGTGYRLVASATSLTSATGQPFDVAAFGTANKLGFIVNPSNAFGGQKNPALIQVAVQDFAGNTVSDHPATSINLHLNQNPGSAGIFGNLTVTTVSGVATFDSVVVDRAANGYVLGACVQPGCQFFGASTAFNVSVGAAAKLSWEPQQPPNTTGGVVFNPAPKVAVTDLGGNTVTSATNSITVSIKPGTGPSGAILSGTNPVSAVNGVATFSNLKIDKTGCYQLDAAATGLTLASSNGFCVNTGPAAKLAFTTEPSNTFVNAPLNPTNTVTVEIQDAGGNRLFESTANQTITLSIVNNPGGATLGGTVAVAAVNGSASFSDASLDKVGTGYTVRATATGLAADTSVAFNVSAFSTANKLVWKVGPANVVARTTLLPALELHVTDQWNNTVTSGTGSNATMHEMHFSQSPSNATLYGTKLKSAVAGVATYNDISLGLAGTNYRLRVCIDGPPVFGCYDTSPFDVASGVETVVSSVATPRAVATSGTTVVYGYQGGLATAPISTGVPTVIHNAGANEVHTLVVDGTDVYFIEGGSGGAVKKVPLAGGTVTTLVASSGANIASGSLAVDGSYVYFAQVVTGGDASYNIVRVPKGGGATQVIYNNGLGGSAATAFAYDGSTNLFVNRTNGEFVRVNTSTLASTPFCCTANPSSVNRMLVAGGIVYATNGAGNIARMTTGGGFQGDIVGGQGNIMGLAIGTDFLYWVEDIGTSSNVKRIQLASPNAQDVISSGVPGWSIWVDGNKVYWTESQAGGRIARAPR